MKSVSRITISVYLMVLSFIIITIVAGPGGLLSYKELNSYKISISENIKELEKINSSLQIESERLIHDSDNIKIKARELGWIDYDEGIIVVKGFSRTQAGYSMGKLLSREHNPQENTTIYRLISLMTGLLFYIASGFLRKSRSM